MEKERVIKVEIIEENICKLPNCDCGWNITLAGKDIEGLEELKKLLKVKRVVVDTN